jgi:acetyl-CoA acyltransferase
MPEPNKDRSVAVVAGLRTPFAKVGTELASLSAETLGQLVVAELIERVDLDPRAIEQVVFGRVIPSIEAPNIAREIVLRADLPRDIEAYTVSEACITGYRAVVALAQAIQAGDIDCGVAGGAESASQVPMMLTEPLRKALLEARAASSIADRISPFTKLEPSDLLPKTPALVEPSTGETMGEAAERMVKVNEISRRAQDEYAHSSHQKAAAAWASGHFDDQVMSVLVPPEYERAVERDSLVRADSKLGAYEELDPVFDREHGSITAGSSSPLTDGASALLLMSTQKARALGLRPLGTIVSYAFAAVDPAEQLLIGPVHATPLALERAGRTLDQIDLIDMHEAFAGQMLSVLKAFASDEYARERLGRESAIGRIPDAILNVDGGSIALGHPFAATGGRQILQLLRALQRRGGGVGLCTACAAGGMGAAMVLEVSA